MENNQDIIEFFETLISDTMDETAEYALLNQVDTIIRKTRPWEILKSEDASKTRVSGETFLNSKVLPVDFDRPYKMFVGDTQLPGLKRLRNEDKRKFRNSSGFYFIDYKNRTYSISSGTQAGTIYNNYIYKPFPLAKDADATHLDTPVFTDFLHIYAYKMAEVNMGGIDEDDRSLQSVPQWVRSYRELWDAMIAWDAELKENDLYQQQYQDDPGDQIIDLGLL